MAIWCKVDKRILVGEKHLLCGFVYVPPHTSPFSITENFDVLENEIGDFKDLRASNLLLMGDFNAKIKDMEDRLLLNKHDIFSDLAEDSCTPIVKRSSQDMHNPDLYGKKLIQLCITLGINIVNGRVGIDKDIGKFTTKNCSVIDYAMASPELFSHFEGFEIQEFNTVLSDVHAPLSLALKCQKFTNNGSKIKIVPKPKWDPAKKTAFIENFQCAELDNVKAKLEDFDNFEQSGKIEEILLDINTIFENAKVKSFPIKCLNFSKKNVWYDSALNQAKRNYSAARKRKNKQISSAHGRFYKKLLICKWKTHSEKLTSNLRSLKSDDPRKYWTTLKAATKSKTECNVSPAEFEKHFRVLNETGLEVGGESSVPNVNDNISNGSENEPLNMCTAMQELNKPITHDELAKALKCLKNNKATGPDQICNEQIKSTFNCMKDVYLKLFNCIFDSGNFPESWAEGLIVPIYKKKGSKEDPNNYRGVTLLSCLGKYFNSILNARFKKVSNKLISQIQAGFREGFSTMDHVFTIVSIINLYEKMGLNLYVAFIDYQKAFDTIWRDGLWFKLVKEGIGGKFLNIIKNMYSKSKSCVLINGQKSQFFSSQAGVRQGEILSPLLFAFYINDLEEFLKSKKINQLENLSKISGEVSDHLGLEPGFMLDLLALYYADDTILMSESPDELQKALDELYNYCQKWKLKVNEDKTKILCFTKKTEKSASLFLQ